MIVYGIWSCVIVYNWFLIYVGLFLTSICFLNCGGSVNICLWHSICATWTSINFFFNSWVYNLSKSSVFTVWYMNFIKSIKLFDRLLMWYWNSWLLITLVLFFSFTRSQTSCINIVVFLFSYLICHGWILVFWYFIAMSIRILFSVSILYTTFNIRHCWWFRISSFFKVVFVCSICLLIVISLQIIKLGFFV